MVEKQQVRTDDRSLPRKVPDAIPPGPHQEPLQPTMEAERPFEMGKTLKAPEVLERYRGSTSISSTASSLPSFLAGLFSSLSSFRVDLHSEEQWVTCNGTRDSDTNRPLFPPPSAHGWNGIVCILEGKGSVAVPLVATTLCWSRSPSILPDK